MLLWNRKNGLDSLFKEVRVFKVLDKEFRGAVRVGSRGSLMLGFSPIFEVFSGLPSGLT